MRFMQIQPAELTSRGKLLAKLNVLAVIFLWIYPLFFQSLLPETVPVHFNLEGKPDRQGSKEELLLIPLSLSIAPLIILLATKYRFTLINRYPYLVNLPSFYINIGKIKPERRSYWVNRYFELLLLFSLLMTLSFILLEHAIFSAALSGELPVWFYLFIALPFLLVIWLLYSLSKLSAEMSKEI